MESEELELYNTLITSTDPFVQLLGYNMSYLANNNYYVFKVDELEKEKDKLYKDNCKLTDQVMELRDDYSHILRKYKKLKPPEASKKRKSDEIIEPSKIKKRRKNKASLGPEEVKRIFSNINSIQDIINLKNYGNKIYHDVKLVKLVNIIPPLEKLHNMVGLQEVKAQLFDHILYFIQSLNQNEMYHTVISGPPGVGKTELGKILGSIYLGLGILKNETFRVVKRSELVGKYLGHTAAQTQEIIDECNGGVMFIDEAYSLGNEEKRDSFSKECLDTINQNLTENKGNFMCIIAGYKDSLNKCFFSYNEGLKRRFPFWYDIKGYTADELKEIFIRKVDSSGWKLKSDIKSDFFEEKFEFYGGDIENFTFLARMAYSKRIFKNSEEDDKVLCLTDLEEAYKQFNANKEKLEIKQCPPPFGMYV